eukprot:11455160-Ditylum_brightwellii.AAC.1
MEQNNKDNADSTTAEDEENLKPSVGSLILGSRRSNGGGVGAVADIGIASLASSSSSSRRCVFTLSTTATKLLLPPPVIDNTEDFLAATSSYHDNNNDETPGFQLHTEEEGEDTMSAPPVG